MKKSRKLAWVVLAVAIVILALNAWEPRLLVPTKLEYVEFLSMEEAESDAVGLGGLYDFRCGQRGIRGWYRKSRWRGSRWRWCLLRQDGRRRSGGQRKDSENA